jgi:hypothetical protein
MHWNQIIQEKYIVYNYSIINMFIAILNISIKNIVAGPRSRKVYLYPAMDEALM